MILKARRKGFSNEALRKYIAERKEKGLPLLVSDNGKEYPYIFHEPKPSAEAFIKAKAMMLAGTDKVPIIMGTGGALYGDDLLKTMNGQDFYVGIESLKHWEEFFKNEFEKNQKQFKIELAKPKKSCMVSTKGTNRTKPKKKR